MPSSEVNQLLAAAAEACDERKAEDIRILALDPADSGLADYFLICTGSSDRQNVAITDAIELKLKHEFGVYPNSVEGRRQGEWILMDYFNFIVHVFLPEKRAFYGLERLRKTATTLSLEQLNTELAKQTAAQIAPARKSAGKKAAKKSSSVKAAKKSPGAKAAAGKKSAGKKAAAKGPTARKKSAAKKVKEA